MTMTDSSLIRQVTRFASVVRDRENRIPDLTVLFNGKDKHMLAASPIFVKCIPMGGGRDMNQRAE
jgi:hypothetical protein